MLGLFKDKKLISILKPLLGDEIGVSPIMHLRAKPPAKYGLNNFSFGVPMHQDHITLDNDSQNT